MRLNKFTILVVFFILVAGLNAQQNRGSNRFDREGYKVKKAEYLRQELNLTDAEFRAFIPLLNEFIEKRFDLNKTLRTESNALRDNPKATEADYKKALDNYLIAKEKELALEKEYFEKFKLVLPAEKVYKYQRAGARFKDQALHEYREMRKSTPKNN